MLIIGERINSSRRQVQEALERMDSEFFRKEASRQVEAGAAYVDVNTAAMISREAEYMAWLVQEIQGVLDVPLCIDSPSPEAVQAALKVHKGRAIINSITGERERFEGMLPLAKTYNAKLIALCMDDKGMPETAQDRLRIASDLLDKLQNAGINKDDIYFDPLVKPVSAGSNYGVEVLNSIRLIKEELGAKVVCGLSNVSFGLPHRKLLNQAFLVMTMAAGLDAVILDPLDLTLMSFLKASRVLLGQDEFATDYISAYRAGLLVKT